MFETWVIARREFKSYFAMPAAYVVLVVFMAVTGYLFTLSIFMTREANLQYVFRSMAIVLLFLVPALTMRLVAEDKRSGIRGDPNRADDPEYIVRLVGQVVRVSLETVRVVKGLSAREL